MKWLCCWSKKTDEGLGDELRKNRLGGAVDESHLAPSNLRTGERSKDGQGASPVVTFRNDISYINGSAHANLPDQSGISLSTTNPNPGDGNMSISCPEDGNVLKDHTVEKNTSTADTTQMKLKALDIALQKNAHDAAMVEMKHLETCTVEKNTTTADTRLPPVCTATSDASTVLIESDSDTVWSRTESDGGAGIADGTNTGPGTEVGNPLQCGTPTVGTSSDPVETPASTSSKSAQFSPVDEIGSPGILATPPSANETIKSCVSAEEFALPIAHVRSNETPKEEDDCTAKVDQTADAGIDFPEREVRPLNPFEEESLNPFEEEPGNPFEEEPGNPFEEESLNPFGSVDGSEPFVREDVPMDEEKEHLQTKVACGSPLNPFDSPMTYCAITTGVALPSAESSPETISDVPDMYGSIDPLDICNDRAIIAQTPLRRRASEAVSLEDSLVFPSLQDTMASLERSATPSKTHSMNLPSPPHKMEDTTDNNSGMCSAPATVADIPLLLTESSLSPAPGSQEEEPSPLRASNSSKSWEGFDIIDAAQMELASIIKETRS